MTCGTKDGHKRHLRRGEDPCDACVEARRADDRERARKSRAGGGPLTGGGRAPLTEAACVPWTGLHDSRHWGESEEQWIARLGRARRVCRRCPALATCRDQARAYRERQKRLDGIFAGRPYVFRGVR